MTVFGAGGGTSSYRECEDADLIVFWGSNAREAHPIFFHHALKAIHKGAKVYSVDPRRSKTAEWADNWLGLDVGTDIALAYGVGREIIHAGLVNEAFVANATIGFEEYVAACEPWTLEVTARETGVPAELIRELAHDYAKAERAQLCWTLGITEHHNGTDNVRALCNLALHEAHHGRRRQARERVADEAPVARHVHERHLAARGQRGPREAQVDGEPATLLLFPAVRLHPRQRADQRALAVVDVAGRRDDVRRRRRAGQRVGAGHHARAGRRGALRGVSFLGGVGVAANGGGGQKSNLPGRVTRPHQS